MKVKMKTLLLSLALVSANLCVAQSVEEVAQAVLEKAKNGDAASYALIKAGPSETMTVELFMKAANNDPVALFDAGMILRDSKGMEMYEKNEQTARYLFQKAAELNYAPALYRVGEDQKFKDKNQYEADQNFSKAKQILESMSEAELSADPRQLVALGWIYRFGNGVTADMEKGADLFEKAAQTGDAEGAYYLANCYYQGKGRTYDKELAKKYYEMAAEKNIMGAINTLGSMAQNDNDYVKAARWYKKAADAKNFYGRLLYADLIRKGGNGLEKNLQEAINYYLPEAQKKEKFYPVEQLAECYEEAGLYDEALKWFELALDRGSDRAYNDIDRVNQKKRDVRNAKWRAEDKAAAEKLYRSRKFVGYGVGHIAQLGEFGYLSNWDNRSLGANSSATTDITLKDGSKYRLKISGGVVQSATKLK